MQSFFFLPQLHLVTANQTSWSKHASESNALQRCVILTIDVFEGFDGKTYKRLWNGSFTLKSNLSWKSVPFFSVVCTTLGTAVAGAPPYPVGLPIQNVLWCIRADMYCCIIQVKLHRASIAPSLWWTWVIQFFWSVSSTIRRHTPRQGCPSDEVHS